MNESEFVVAWREYLKGPQFGLHLANPQHPLQIFVGATDQGGPRLVMRSGAKPPKPDLSNLVLVERYEDQSGKWNLSLTLQDGRFAEVFLRLADHLYARSSEARSEVAALDLVATLLEEWKRLLASRRTGLLSLEQLRGLVGELWLLLYDFAPGHGFAAAVEGWLGPMGLPQDFWYPEAGLLEAKSIGPSMGHVKISSEAQMDADDLRLAVLVVPNSNEQTVGAVNLPTLAGRVIAGLRAETQEVQPFHDRIARLGVNLDEAFYQDTWFIVSSISTYNVPPHFPAIRQSQLPGGISRVRYQIQLAAIEEYRSEIRKVN